MISDKINRIRPDGKNVEPRFLELSLAAPFSQEHIISRKTGLADAQVNISQAILKSTPITYPDLPTQRRIVRELDALQAEVDGLKRLQAKAQAELDALLPAVLEGVFKQNQTKAYPELDVELGMATEPAGLAYGKRQK